MLIPRGLPHFTRSIRVHVRDANADDDVGPRRVPRVCSDHAGGHDGDVRDRIIACREERGARQTAGMRTVGPRAKTRTWRLWTDPSRCKCSLEVDERSRDFPAAR